MRVKSPILKSKTQGQATAEYLFMFAIVILVILLFRGRLTDAFNRVNQSGASELMRTSNFAFEDVLR